MPVIWRNRGAGIGQHGVSVSYHGLKGDASREMREYRKDNGRKAGVGPEKVIVRGRDSIIELLNEAIAVSTGNKPAETTDDDSGSEFL